MPLEMRSSCERCHTDLPPQADAYICIFECTFCGTCAGELEKRCPNCGNEQVPRPRKTGSPV
jgi:hypothetical protein